MAPAGERAMRKRGSGSSSHPPVPVLNTNIVARTGSFVVFEHNSMYMRGLALWFALYLPPKGGRCTPLMPEFKNQVVLIAYVYVAAFDQNCLALPSPFHPNPTPTLTPIYEKWRGTRGTLRRPTRAVAAPARRSLSLARVRVSVQPRPLGQVEIDRLAGNDAR